MSTCRAVYVFFGSLLLPALASAQISNLGFETGFDGWSTVGNPFLTSSAIGIDPIEGVAHALFATATDGTAGFASGVGVGRSDAATFLGLTEADLEAKGVPSAGYVSAVSTTISVSNGDTIEFDWNFLTNQTYLDPSSTSRRPDPASRDFAFVSITAGGVSQMSMFSTLADTFFGYADDPGAPGGFVSGFRLTPLGPGPDFALVNPFLSETGYQRFSWVSSYTGVITLGIGVTNATTGTHNGINSGLLVDNLQILPVPEPASMVALGLGLAGALVRRRRGRA